MDTYEKKYKEALERAEKALEVFGTDKCEGARQIFSLFPELKESEDERTRKWLIAQLKIKIGDNATLNNMIYKAIAWLEKQGEQGTMKEKKPKKDICIGCYYAINHKCAIDIKGYCPREKHFDYENANIQQKDFAPQKDIPRYSIGDVLCDKSCTTLNKESQSNFEITDIRNGMYICDKCSFPISQQDEYELVAKRIEQNPTDLEIFISELSKQFPDVSFAKLSRIAVRTAKWAKPADSHCSDCTNAKGCVNCTDGDMKETEKPAWSEEDECYMTECINAIATKDGWSFEEKRKTKHWLKSLKERL